MCMLRYANVERKRFNIERAKKRKNWGCQPLREKQEKGSEDNAEDAGGLRKRN